MQAQGLNLNDVNGDYVVRQGDTLSAISIAANESMAQIAQDNHLTNLDMIYVGQILHLRHTGSATDSTMISNATHANVAGNGTKVALPSRTAEQVKANAMVNQGIMPNATASSIATPAGHATADKASGKADNKAGNKASDTHANANGSSQAANHGSHASSATSSSVNGGKHDQAAASSSAQPATSNSQASSSKPASSTANKPADKPATSGSQASSSQTGSQSTPAQGSSSTTPSQNGSSAAPSQGSSSQTPSQSSSSTTPSQSGNTTTPSQGSSHHKEAAHKLLTITMAQLMPTVPLTIKQR